MSLGKEKARVEARASLSSSKTTTPFTPQPLRPDSEPFKIAILYSKYSTISQQPIKVFGKDTSPDLSSCYSIIGSGLSVQKQYEGCAKGFARVRRAFILLIAFMCPS